jgi:hypothetical protein
MQTCKDWRVHSGEQRHFSILSQSPDMTSSLSIFTKTRSHRHSLSQPQHPSRAISVSCTDEPSPDYGTIPVATALHFWTTSEACCVVSCRVASRASRRAAMFVLSCHLCLYQLIAELIQFWSCARTGKPKNFQLSRTDFSCSRFLLSLVVD